jgi:hypothetical protein
MNILPLILISQGLMISFLVNDKFKYFVIIVNLFTNPGIGIFIGVLSLLMAICVRLNLAT